MHSATSEKNQFSEVQLRNPKIIYEVKDPNWYKDSPYDKFDSMIVEANDEDGARLLHPLGDYTWIPERNGWFQTQYLDQDVPGYYQDEDWGNPDTLEVRMLGFSMNNTDKPDRILLTSFNAG